MHEALLAAWMLEKGHSCAAADICYWAVWAPRCDPLCCHSAEAFKTMWRELRGQLNPGQGWFMIHCNNTTTRNVAAYGCARMCSRIYSLVYYRERLQSCHIYQVFNDKGHVKLDLKAPSDPKTEPKMAPGATVNWILHHMTQFGQCLHIYSAYSTFKWKERHALTHNHRRPLTSLTTWCESVMVTLFTASSVPLQPGLRRNFHCLSIHLNGTDKLWNSTGITNHMKSRSRLTKTNCWKLFLLPSNATQTSSLW